MVKRTRQPWMMIALCLVAFTLRLGPLWANRFHPDEALYASWGLLIRTGRDIWLSHQSADKPPLQFYLMAVSFNYLWRSEVAARLPGLIAGTLSVPLIFQISNISRYVYSRFKFKIPDSSLQSPASNFRLAAWIAAALVAFSPFAILYSPTAFLDPVMVMFALAACAAAGRKHAGWAGVLVGLSAATKLTGLLFLPLVIGLQVEGLRLKVKNLTFRFPLSAFHFWAGLLGVLALVIAWDRIKGGTPFWVQQAVNYGGLRIAPLVQALPRLRDWISFFPYFFGWPTLIVIVILAIVNFRFQISDFRLATFHLPLFFLFYFATHWLLTFQVWDRYLLGLVPVAALLTGELIASFVTRISYSVFCIPHSAFRIPQYASRSTRHALRSALYLFPVILLLPSALIAARSGYPIGGDHGAYDGIEQVADYLRAKPKGTVIYDRWLTWEFEYYLWDAQAYRAYFPSPDFLRDDLHAFGSDPPRYVTVPAYEPTQPVLDAIAQAGFDASPVLTTTSRRDQPTFTVYQITPQRPQNHD